MQLRMKAMKEKQQLQGIKNSNIKMSLMSIIRSEKAKKEEIKAFEKSRY